MAANLRHHWPEYLIEAWALGMFMVSCGVFTVLVEHPASPVHALLPDAGARRLVVGVAMGLTLLGLVYSRWGKRSGAHMNPAVTLTFLSLGKIRPADAAYYIAAQFAGGLAGVALVAAVLGRLFTDVPIRWAATVPGPDGIGMAFLFEVLISFGLMTAVLVFTNRARLMPYTGLAAGTLLVLYITFESPLSGMSMNPARTFASAAPQQLWADLWIYFVAPLTGMLLAALAYQQLFGRDKVDCAKLYHADDVRCIHCGYEPARALGPKPPPRYTAPHTTL